jgi:hypothetical protein
MGKELKENAIIPTLLAGAAVYFGMTRNSSKLGDVTKMAVSRLVDDQVSRNTGGQPKPNNHKMKHKTAKSKSNKTNKIRLHDIQHR